MIKTGELMALVALELALKSRYGSRIHGQKMLNQLLEYIIVSDGLTNKRIPMFQKYGYEIVENLYKPKGAKLAQNKNYIAPPMTLSSIRNSLAHGDPFDKLPRSGLLELVRDLIEYAYRDLIAKERVS